MRVVGIMVVVVIWEIVSRAMAHPAFTPPSIIVPALVRMMGDVSFYRHIASTMMIVWIGLTIAISAGVVLAIVIHLFAPVRWMLMPVVDSIRPVAALTLFPVLIILLGLGVSSKSFVIFWTSWPAVLLNSLHGLDNVDRDVIEAGQLDGANKFQLLYHISFPLAIPMILTGVRIGVSGGFISLVAAEMLGSSTGLGYAILSYSQTFQFAEMYAVIIVIALLGLGMNLGVVVLQNQNDKKGESHVSPFIRFGHRAASYSLDADSFTSKGH